MFPHAAITEPLLLYPTGKGADDEVVICVSLKKDVIPDGEEEATIESGLDPFLILLRPFGSPSGIH